MKQPSDDDTLEAYLAAEFGLPPDSEEVQTALLAAKGWLEHSIGLVGEWQDASALRVLRDTLLTKKSRT